MITEDQAFAVLRAFIMGLAGQQEVLRTPINRAAMPVGSFVAMTPGRFKPLSTNSSAVTSTTRTVRRPSLFECQIDCYGPSSSDLANTLSILFRDPYAAEQFAATGLEIAPLYADEAQQMPIVNGEDQYEERWTFKVAMQINHVVSTGQQSANIAVVNIINVDSTYPPT